MSYVEHVIKATGGHAAPAEVLEEDSYSDFILEFDEEDLEYLAEVGEEYEELEEDEEEIPEGYHRMPDGEIMRDDAHSIQATAGSKPAPKKDQIKGSSKNKKGSAATGKGVTFSAKVIKALENKVEKHNEKHGDTASKKTSLRTLKAVYRRGAGAFSTSHRPDQNRNSWAMARVNAFLHLLRTGSPKNKKYVTDNDLLPAAHRRSSKKSAAIAAAANPCWEGYIQVGTKQKNGETVPNCVPKDAAVVDIDDLLYSLQKADTVEDIQPHVITYALNESKKFDAPRAVTFAQVQALLASAETPADAVADVVTFIELAQYGDVYENALDFVDLLPAGHPNARRKGLAASALAEAQAEWYAADPQMSAQARLAATEYLTSEFKSTEKAFASMKLEALAAAGELIPLVAAWKISAAKRSAMSRALAAIRRRDRKGRFAEEFGRLKGFFSGGPDGDFTAVGRIVGATEGKNEFQVEYKGHSVIPDGVYRLAADKAENVGAYLPQRIVSKLPKRDAKFDEKDKDSLVPLEEFLATRMDAPEGWTAIKNEQGKTTGYQSADGNRILSMEKPNADKAKEIADGDTPAFGIGESEAFDPEGDIFTLKDEDGNVLAYAQDWATAQKANIYLGLEDEDEPEEETDQPSLGEQYGLEPMAAKDTYRVNGQGGDKYEVYKDSRDDTWVVETTYDDGNKDEQRFDTDEDAFKYVAGQAGLDPELDDKVETPEEKPKANDDGVEYGKYTPEEVADGYQFGKPMEGKWLYDNASYIDDNDNQIDGVQVQVSEQKGKWFVELEDNNGRIWESQEFETPEDAFEYASWQAGTEWDQDWVDDQQDSKLDDLADKYGFERTTNGFEREAGFGGTYEVYENQDGKGNLETRYDDGNETTETFDSVEEALKWVSDYEGDDRGDSESDATPETPEAPEAPEAAKVGKLLEKKNTDEDGIIINDLFYADDGIDSHREAYFITNRSDLADALENSWDGDAATYGDYMTGGAQVLVTENEDGKFETRVSFPNDDDVIEEFDDLEEAINFGATEAAVHNTNAIPSAFSSERSFSDLDRQLSALETPDQALTFATRLDEVAQALEDTRGNDKDIKSLRGMAEMIREEYGEGDDSQETRFFRMMAEEAPLSSSINPSTDVNSVDAPEGSGSTDAKKSVTSNQEAVNKVMSGILEAIESGEAMPWRQPFTDDPALAGASVPRNPATKHVYSGVNAMVLRWVAGREGYEDGRWMTYKNAQDLGGNVRKGEKGTFILAPRMIPRKDKDGNEVIGSDGKPEKFIVFRAMAVFNVAQIDGLDLPDEKKNTDLVAKTPLEAQEFVIERYKKSMEALGLKVPEINYTYVGQYGSHSSSPNWSPMFDNITLPTLEQFNSPEEIFDTLMHELAHSTGHASRLDRSELTKDYSKPDGIARAKEELIAEISSAILGQMFGIENTLDNSAAYVQSWLKRLQDSPQEVMNATKEAQKVVDYMLGMHLGDWSPVDGYKVSKGGSN